MSDKIEKLKLKSERNKIYYNKNRLIVLDKIKVKTQCNCCDRIVTFGAMVKHKNSKLCKKYSERKLEITEI